MRGCNGSEGGVFEVHNLACAYGMWKKDFAVIREGMEGMGKAETGWEGERGMLEGYVFRGCSGRCVVR